jgi:hypothetical protein
VGAGEPLAAAVKVTVPPVTAVWGAGMLGDHRCSLEREPGGVAHHRTGGVGYEHRVYPGVGGIGGREAETGSGGAGDRAAVLAPLIRRRRRAGGRHREGDTPAQHDRLRLGLHLDDRHRGHRRPAGGGEFQVLEREAEGGGSRGRRAAAERPARDSGGIETRRPRHDRDPHHPGGAGGKAGHRRRKHRGVETLVLELDDQRPGGIARVALRGYRNRGHAGGIEGETLGAPAVVVAGGAADGDGGRSPYDLAVPTREGEGRTASAGRVESIQGNRRRLGEKGEGTGEQTQDDGQAGGACADRRRKGDPRLHCWTPPSGGGGGA